MNEPLGTFLFTLKRNGDLNYKRFLNPHGDSIYCKFVTSRGTLSSLKGIYCYCLNQRLVYVGRSLDPFAKRINQGYGTIHPKNCYLDGQWPNCRLNALIAAHIDSVSCYACALSDNHEIEQLERRLIQTLKPEWNIALK